MRTIDAAHDVRLELSGGAGREAVARVLDCTPSSDPRRPWRQRDVALQELGYASYEDYLRSERWQSRRQQVAWAPSGCAVCGVIPVEVHHLYYGRLGGERPDDLAALCRECHYAAHLLVGDVGVSLFTSVTDLDRLARRFLREHGYQGRPHENLALGNFCRLVLPAVIASTAVALNITVSYRLSPRQRRHGEER